MIFVRALALHLVCMGWEHDRWHIWRR